MQATIAIARATKRSYFSLKESALHRTGSPSRPLATHRLFFPSPFLIVLYSPSARKAPYRRTRISYSSALCRFFFLFFLFIYTSTRITWRTGGNGECHGAEYKSVRPVDLCVGMNNTTISYIGCV